MERFIDLLILLWHLLPTKIIQCSNKGSTRISNHINIKLWDINIHSCPNFSRHWTYDMEELLHRLEHNGM